VNFDFVIFTPGRAGSHLLASLLNSHPDIACEGEFGRVDSLINPDDLYGSVHGCILSFSQRNLLLKWNPMRVIYMTRSPEGGADSYAKNIIRYKARKVGNAYEFDPFVTDEERLSTIRKLECIHFASRNLLKTFNYLEISYEELTDNKNICWVITSIRDRVCDFLGVKRRDLYTDLVKRHNPEVDD
jgi:hypothetical protein